MPGQLGTRSSGLAEPCCENSLLCLLTLEVKGILCHWRGRLVNRVTFGLSCPWEHQACLESSPEALPWYLWQLSSCLDFSAVRTCGAWAETMVHLLMKYLHGTLSHYFSSLTQVCSWL